MLNNYSDIDECEQGADNCSRVLPAPATCVNSIGGYRCSCDNYIGYRLAPDYKSCAGNPYVTLILIIYRTYNAVFLYRC